MLVQPTASGAVLRAPAVSVGHNREIQRDTATLCCEGILFESQSVHQLSVLSFALDSVKIYHGRFILNS